MEARWDGSVPYLRTSAAQRVNQSRGQSLVNGKRRSGGKDASIGRKEAEGQGEGAAFDLLGIQDVGGEGGTDHL